MNLHSCLLALAFYPRFNLSCYTELFPLLLDSESCLLPSTQFPRPFRKLQILVAPALHPAGTGGPSCKYNIGHCSAICPVQRDPPRGMQHGGGAPSPCVGKRYTRICVFYNYSLLYIHIYIFQRICLFMHVHHEQYTPPPSTAPAQPSPASPPRTRP